MINITCTASKINQNYISNFGGNEAKKKIVLCSQIISKLNSRREAELVAVPEDDDWRPVPGPTSLLCLSLSLDSFSALRRSCRFRILFSKVLDIVTVFWSTIKFTAGHHLAQNIWQFSHHSSAPFGSEHCAAGCTHFSRTNTSFICFEITRLCHDKIILQIFANIKLFDCVYKQLATIYCLF